MTMSRRSFVHTSLAAAAASAIAGRASAQRTLGPIGVQLYSVRDLMKADVPGTLAKIAAIGFKEVEFAGLFAPKPQGMTAANDWTKEMATKGFPELQALYKLFGADKNVQLFANTHFQHNYNYVSRAAFFGSTQSS